MDQKIPELNLKNAIGVAGSAVLLAPFGIPIMHGVAGIAVAGATLFAAGKVISKTVNVLADTTAPRQNSDDSPSS